MFRVAGVAGVDPRWTIAAARDCAAAVLAYIGEDEPRPARAIEVVEDWLRGDTRSEVCLQAAEGAEDAARAYREARKSVDMSLRRSYRAAAYASYAACRAARAAQEAALVGELEYDEHYTFDDAWNGARLSCAEQAARVAHDVVEAAVSATAAQVTEQTGSYVAGGAAAKESREVSKKWAADLIRARIPAHVVVESADVMLGPNHSTRR